MVAAETAPVVAAGAAPVAEAGRKAFESGSAELAKMLGQQAPAAEAAASTAAPQIAQRLRQIAETSAANKAIVMEAIKKDFEAAGFPTWQAFRDYVFQARTRL